MRTHKSYIDTFRTIAATHVDIAHNPEENRFRFARIIDSARSLYEPYYHIQEVLELHQDKLETPCLLVESRVKEFEKSQQVHGMMTGAFIIMIKAERGDFDSEETALDDAERLVNHVMSYLKKLFMDDSSIGRLNWDNVRMNPVGPILDGFFGVRCDFSWQKSLNSDFCYDEQYWIQLVTDHCQEFFDNLTDEQKACLEVYTLDGGVAGTPFTTSIGVIAGQLGEHENDACSTCSEVGTNFSNDCQTFIEQLNEEQTSCFEIELITDRVAGEAYPDDYVILNGGNT